MSKQEIWDPQNKITIAPWRPAPSIGEWTYFYEASLEAEPPVQSRRDSPALCVKKRRKTRVEQADAHPRHFAWNIDPESAVASLCVEAERPETRALEDAPLDPFLCDGTCVVQRRPAAGSSNSV